MNSDNITFASLKSQIESIRNEIITKNTETQILMNEISAKMDILLNIDKQVTVSSTTTNATSGGAATKKPNRPMFFKQLFLNRKDEFMDVLYTQAIIDEYMSHADVVSTPESKKMAKIANLIYIDYIKKDKSKPENAAIQDQFERIYSNA